jgi:hypothetical protein
LFFFGRPEKLFYTCDRFEIPCNEFVILMKNFLGAKSSLLVFVFLSSILTAFAQDPELGMWSSVELKKKIGHGVALAFEEEYRMRESLGTTDRFMTSVDLSWKPLKYLKGGLTYTLINKYDATETEPWETRHRFSGYLTGSYDLGRFEISLKEKFQSTNRVGIVADEDKSNPTNILRSKFSIAYDLRGMPLKPYLSTEIFYALNEPDGTRTLGNVQMFTEGRFGAGLEYDFSKKFSATLGYLYSASTDWDDDVRVNDIKVGGYVNAFQHVLTAGLSYTF